MSFLPLLNSNILPYQFYKIPANKQMVFNEKEQRWFLIEKGTATNQMIHSLDEISQRIADTSIESLCQQLDLCASLSLLNRKIDKHNNTAYSCFCFPFPGLTKPLYEKVDSQSKDFLKALQQANSKNIIELIQHLANNPDLFKTASVTTLEAIINKAIINSNLKNPILKDLINILYQYSQNSLQNHSDNGKTFSFYFYISSLSHLLLHLNNSDQTEIEKHIILKIKHLFTYESINQLGKLGKVLREECKPFFIHLLSIYLKYQAHAFFQSYTTTLSATPDSSISSYKKISKLIKLITSSDQYIEQYPDLHLMVAKYILSTFRKAVEQEERKNVSEALTQFLYEEGKKFTYKRGCHFFSQLIEKNLLDIDSMENKAIQFFLQPYVKLTSSFIENYPKTACNLMDTLVIRGNSQAVTLYFYIYNQNKKLLAIDDPQKLISLLNATANLELLKKEHMKAAFALCKKLASFEPDSLPDDLKIDLIKILHLIGCQKELKLTKFSKPFLLSLVSLLTNNSRILQSHGIGAAAIIKQATAYDLEEEEFISLLTLGNQLPQAIDTFFDTQKEKIKDLFDKNRELGALHSNIAKWLGGNRQTLLKYKRKSTM